MGASQLDHSGDLKDLYACSVSTLDTMELVCSSCKESTTVTTPTKESSSCIPSDWSWTEEDGEALRYDEHAPSFISSQL